MDTTINTNCTPEQNNNDNNNTGTSGESSNDTLNSTNAPRAVTNKRTVTKRTATKRKRCPYVTRRRVRIPLKRSASSGKFCTHESDGGVSNEPVTRSRTTNGLPNGRRMSDLQLLHYERASKRPLAWQNAVASILTTTDISVGVNFSTYGPVTREVAGGSAVTMPPHDMVPCNIETTMCNERWQPLTTAEKSTLYRLAGLESTLRKTGE